MPVYLLTEIDKLLITFRKSPKIYVLRRMTQARIHTIQFVQIRCQKECCINRGTFQTLHWYQHADYVIFQHQFSIAQTVYLTMVRVRPKYFRRWVQEHTAVLINNFICAANGNCVQYCSKNWHLVTLQKKVSESALRTSWWFVFKNLYRMAPPEKIVWSELYGKQNFTALIRITKAPEPLWVSPYVKYSADRISPSAYINV